VSTTVDFVVRHNRIDPIRRLLMFKGEAKTITIDYSPWSEDNGSVTSVVATVKYGDAALSNESLTSDIKTMVVTTSNEGHNMIKLTATAGNNIHVLHILIVVRDPDVVSHDYGYYL